MMNRAPALSAVLLLGLSARAQTTTSTVTGRVTDPTGASIPAAALTAANEETGLHRTATSDQEGGYSLPFLPPGRYRIGVEKAGSKPVA
jgi:hypothetical protein